MKVCGHGEQVLRVRGRRLQPWLLGFTALLSLLACKAKDTGSAALPPASGAGVAGPNIPAVAGLMQPEAEASTKEQGITGTGSLFPREQAELGPKVTGVIRAVEVDEGDTVKKGQVVFRLDAGQSALMVQQAEAQVTSAKTNLRAADLEYQRAKELNARGSLPQAAYEQIQARYEAAQNAVAQSEVAVSMARRSLGDTVVTSPIAGVVTARFKEPGETATMMPVTVVVVIQDVSVLELRVRLAEGALKTLRTGSSLKVTFPAIGGERIVAVKRINPTVDVATRTVEVIAEIDNADQGLKPGMMAQVALAEDSSELSTAATASASSATTAAAPKAPPRPKTKVAVTPAASGVRP
jgi:RND family efflux transporter MFP subunit